MDYVVLQYFYGGFKMNPDHKQIQEWGKEFNERNREKLNEQSTKSAQDLIDELGSNPNSIKKVKC